MTDPYAARPKTYMDNETRYQTLSGNAPFGLPALEGTGARYRGRCVFQVRVTEPRIAPGG